MTPGQLSIYAKGYGDRVKEHYRLAAWHLAPQINLWSKRKVTMAKLLGEQTVNASMFPDAESFKKHLENMSAGID